MVFKRIKKLIRRSFLPYLADLGRVSFIVLIIVILIGAAVEIVHPGMVFNLLAPQILVGLLILTAGLSLLMPTAPHSIWGRLVFMVIGLVIAISIWRSIGDYFQSTGNDRVPLTVAAVGVTVIIFAAATRIGHRTIEK
ncbi:hypothetical protein A2480_01405 [Candidatus Uhrbacteria bacterium RIFOXYC2_FULL_47_19]|uniref:Uncharacterized protein n=1 Tax=Candidatus Uhrbacteria bacterium RIFOXYC2_FULL_47_19 TaxID=1802424 RepID=A0A1F7WCF7_9BACT|nr:MAG: hypothetical protein A2480_01405 [Candidatus Uhrbacteria bacterium RIFOXYC2_FULL_47_19]